MEQGFTQKRVIGLKSTIILLRKKINIDFKMNLYFDKTRLLKGVKVFNFKLLKIITLISTNSQQVSY